MNIFNKDENQSINDYKYGDNIFYKEQFRKVMLDGQEYKWKVCDQCKKIKIDDNYKFVNLLHKNYLLCSKCRQKIYSKLIIFNLILLFLIILLVHLIY